MNENVDDTAGLNSEEVDEMLKEKEAKANAQILEMVSVRKQDIIRVCYLVRARAMAHVVLAQMEFCMCYGNYNYDCILA